MSKINTVKTGWNDAAREIDALVKMADAQGKGEGKASQALPNIALAFAKAAADGKVADVKVAATEIYVAYGKARNASGAGKTIKTEGKAIDPPVSKLGTFAKLAMDKTVLPGTNRSVAEVFFDTFAGDLDLWRGSHYENLYKAAAAQLARIESGHAEVLDRDQIVTLIVGLKETPGGMESSSLKAILEAVEAHIAGAPKKFKGADGKVKLLSNPAKPGFGDPTGDLKTIKAKLAALFAAAEKRDEKAWNKVSSNADAFADKDDDDAAESRSFIGAQ